MDSTPQLRSYWPERLRTWIADEIRSSRDDSSRKRILSKLGCDPKGRLQRLAERLSAEERRFNEAERVENQLPSEMPGGTVRITNFVSAAAALPEVWELQKQLASNRKGLDATRDAVASLLNLLKDNRRYILFGIANWRYEGVARRPDERLATITEELSSLQQICEGLEFYYPEGGDSLPANNKKTFAIRYLRFEAFGSGLDLRDRDIADTVAFVTDLGVTEDDVRKAWSTVIARIRKRGDVPM